MKKKGTKDLTRTQRLLLEDCLKAGLHKRVIAEKLGVCLATVYNELKRGEYEYKKRSYHDYWGESHYKLVKGYSPDKAQEKYELNKTAKGAPLKVGKDYDFIRYVEKRVLYDKLSPCAVCGEIKRKQLFRTVISKTTMYRYIDIGLFMNIHLGDLPIKKSRKHYRKTIAKRPPKGVSIEKRPIEIFNRNSFGHWEMDCVVGIKETKETILALSERKTRYEIIFKIPNRKTETVVKQINKLEKQFGANFRKVFKSITVDNGVEFSDFTGLQRSIYKGKRTNVYYCHPYTSCERGTNERLNREIRRRFPKGTDFTKITDNDIRDAEKWINNYPREIFGFETSAERFNAELSAL